MPTSLHCRPLRGFAAGVVCLALLSSVALADWREPREALDHRHVAGVFRIHYTARGDNALPEGETKAEVLAARLGEQLQDAYRFYDETMGLAPPFETPRYKHLGAIDVHVIAMKNRGSTGDATITYRYRHFGDVMPAMTITISTRWNPGNRTPEHEVFHAYQYGYTFFKNAWYLEGLARGMEGAFRHNRFPTEPLPGDAQALRQLLEKSYDAAPFWNRLMTLCDTACLVEPSGRAQSASGQVCGKGFVKALLEEFQAIDDAAARARGLDPEDWPEREQRAEANTPWMLQGVARAMEAQCPIAANAELKRFHDLAAAYR